MKTLTPHPEQKIRVVMTKVDKEKWKSEKYSIQREWNIKTPNGNNMAGRWVIRNQYDTIIDFDQYINDIADRWNLDLYSGSRK